MPQQEPPFNGDIAPPKEGERLYGMSSASSHSSQKASQKHDDGGGPAVGGGWLAALAGERSSTRWLACLAVGVFSFLLVIGGMWTWFRSHHPEGIPVIGPPPYAVKDRPADPGGMMIMSDDTVKGDETGRGAVHLAPPPEQPDARLLAGRVDAASSSVGGQSALGKVEQGSVEAGKADTVSSAGVESHLDAPSGQGDAGQSVTAKEPVKLPAPQRAAVDAPAPLPAPSPLAPPLSAGEAQKEHRDRAPEVAASQDGAASAYEVQLAALPDEAQARQEWEHLRHKLPDLLGGRSPVFRSVERGGKNFVRVRVGGFADRAAARQFCVRLHAQSQACSVAASH